MGKSLPPFSRRYMPWNMNWYLDWGTRVHLHHHPTRKRPGALKPLRRIKARPTGAKSNFVVMLKRRLRKLFAGFKRRASFRYNDYLQRKNEPWQ